MNPSPTLILRCRREHFQVTCERSLLHILRDVVGPKPPPHPMILGTVTGVTLRKLHGIEIIGREITIPAPHSYWLDVPAERWKTVWADALQLAIEMETLCQLTNKPHDLTIDYFTRHYSCRNELSPPSPALVPS